jgi:hypothetical protein
MNTNSVKFRENAVTSVDRNADGITVYLRETRRTADGGVETVRVLDPIRLAYAGLSEAVRAEALGYGMEVRLTRQAALERDTKTHKPASVQDKWTAIAELAAHYASGTESWTMAGGGGGGLSADTRALILAVQRALGLEADAAEEAVRGMSASTRDALRVDEEIKPHLDAVYAERARAAGSAGVDIKEKLRAMRKG